MTNEDAIKKINLLKMVAVKKGTDTEKAVDMAIEALKEQQVRNDGCGQNKQKSESEKELDRLLYIRYGPHGYGMPGRGR